MSNDYYMDGYENLASAVVEQAVKDYKHALKRIWRHPHDTTAMRLIEDCERFFRNEITMYTDLDGLEIMRKVREIACKEMNGSDQRKAKELQIKQN